jgi:hypothetical protein
LTAGCQQHGTTLSQRNFRWFANSAVVVFTRNSANVSRETSENAVSLTTMLSEDLQSVVMTTTYAPITYRIIPWSGSIPTFNFQQKIGGTEGRD